MTLANLAHPADARLFRRGNKMNARRTEYAGVVYHSKAEAAMAAQLDLRKSAGDLAWWLRQVPVNIGGVTLRVDFVVGEFNCGPDCIKVHAVEVKGMETADWRTKKKLWRHHGPFPLHIVKNGKAVEVIEPVVKGGA